MGHQRVSPKKMSANRVKEVNLVEEGLRHRRAHTQLVETMLCLQRTLEDYITQLKTQHLQQDQVLEEQRHWQDTREQEATLVHFICQAFKLQPQLPGPSLASSGSVGGGQPPQSSRLSHQRSDLKFTFISSDLSNRGIDITALYHASFQDYVAYQADTYHEDKNPLGFINLGVTENKLCIDLMTERLSQSDMNHIDDGLLQNSDMRGPPFLREEVAQFLTWYCKAPAPLDPENVVILNGCCSVFLALSMVLCDPGEAFLTPTSWRSGFAFTSHLYSKVELIYVHLDSEITVAKLENATLEARRKRKKVKGLLLVNSQNPLGGIYSQDSLKEYLEFAKRYNLHVIVDELYMLSVFDKSLTFHSALSMESLPDPKKIHVIWGTSKDFRISGVCFGTLYTHNKEVVSAMSAFGYVHRLSGIAQHKLYRLLQDIEWIDNMYLPTNHSRLQAAHRYVTGYLKASKVPFLDCGSGLHVWIKLTKPCTFEEEQLLHCRFLDHKLILSPGHSSRCKEPGWFHLTFSNKPLILNLAMHRFSEALNEQRQYRIEKLLEDALRE